MRVLLTGICGFVGSTLARGLREGWPDWEILGLDNFARAGSEVLSVVMLRLWIDGKAEQVSVIGLLMVVLVLLFRFVELRLLKHRITAL